MISALGLCVLALISVVFMAMHPTTGTGDPSEYVVRLGRGVPGNTFVHGTLIAVVLLTTGFLLAVRDALGPSRVLVRLGMVALVSGVAGVVAAGLINGFILPGTASRLISQTDQPSESLLAVAMLARETNAVCSRVGMIGLAFAALSWSACICRFPGLTRVVGAVGIVCGVAPLVFHARQHLRMDVPGFSLLVQFHSVWLVTAAIFLFRQRRHDQADQ